MAAICDCSFRCEKCQEPLRYPLIYGLQPDMQKLIAEKAKIEPHYTFYHTGASREFCIYHGSKVKYRLFIHNITWSLLIEHIKEKKHREKVEKKLDAYLRGDKWIFTLRNNDKFMGTIAFSIWKNKNDIVLAAHKNSEHHTLFTRATYEKVLDNLVQDIWNRLLKNAERKEEPMEMSKELIEELSDL